MLGLTYMLQFKEIKKKHLGYFYTRLPSLQILDVMNSRAVTIGWLFLTSASSSASIWTARRGRSRRTTRTSRRCRSNDPKIFVALLDVGGVLVRGLRAADDGVDGRRAAWLSALGFAIVLLNFLPVSYFVTTSHTFRLTRSDGCAMHLFLLGVSHRTAPVDLRERLDFSSRDLGAAVEALAMRPSAAESVVLSTCNRSEIYVASDDPGAARDRTSIAFLSRLPPAAARGVRAAPVRHSDRGRRARTCSASPRGWIRSSSASRRSSAR